MTNLTTRVGRTTLFLAALLFLLPAPATFLLLAPATFLLAPTLDTTHHDVFEDQLTRLYDAESNGPG